MLSAQSSPFLRLGGFGFIFLVISMSANCLNSGDSSINLERKFWARKINQMTGTTSQYQIDAELKSESAHTLIFVQHGAAVSETSIRGLAAVAEERIMPIEHQWLSAPMDIDRNDKVILLLMDIEDGYQTGGSYVAGYFDAINQFSDVDTFSHLQLHSNQAEMLYLDTYPANVNSDKFLATVAHEYQHLLQFTNNVSHGVAEEPWVDEGLAEIMSDVTGFGPQTDRAEYFRSSILTSDSLIQFDNSDPLKDYASAYMYFRYLYDVYGISGISKIFKSPEIGVSGVDAALQSLDSGILSHCGSTSGLLKPYFACSYRLMWAGLVNTLGAMPAVININYAGTADTMNTTGAVNYNWNISDLNLRNTIMATLTAGARLRPATPASTGPLGGYAPTLFQTNYPAGSAATFSSCAGCGMTIISGNLYFAVFNHNITATPLTTSVVDFQVNGVTRNALSAATSESQTQTPDQRGQAIHWHFPLQRQYLETFRQIAEERKVIEETNL